MSAVDSKTLNIILEEYSDFGYRLTLEDVAEVCQEHPVTGEPTGCKEVSSPIDINPFTFAGDIKDSLEDGATVLGSFTFTKTSPSGGKVDMTLTREQVATIIQSASSTRDTYNPRLRFVGYYDVLVDTTEVHNRIMQGTVYVSDGVTE